MESEGSASWNLQKFCSRVEEIKKSFLSSEKNNWGFLNWYLRENGYWKSVMSLFNSDLITSLGTLKIRLLNSGLNVQCHFNSTWASSTVVIDITACTELNIIVKSPSINQFFFHIEVLLISICPGFTWDRVDFFFIVSGMMLSSGFKRKPVLIKYWYFTCCWAMPYRTKDFSVSQLLVLLC